MRRRFAALGLGLALTGGTWVLGAAPASAAHEECNLIPYQHGFGVYLPFIKDAVRDGTMSNRDAGRTLRVIARFPGVPVAPPCSNRPPRPAR